MEALDFLPPLLRQITFVLGVLGGFAVVVTAIGYFLGSFRKGRYQAATEATEVWKGEVEALKAKLSRMQIDYRSEMDKMHGELREMTEERKFLEGRVAQLSKENTDLKSIVLGEKLPEVFSRSFEGMLAEIMEGMRGVAQHNLQVYTSLVQSMEEDYLHPLKTKIVSIEKKVLGQKGEG